MIANLLLAATAVTCVVLAARAAWTFINPWGDE